MIVLAVLGFNTTIVQAHGHAGAAAATVSIPTSITVRAPTRMTMGPLRVPTTTTATATTANITTRAVLLQCRMGARDRLRPILSAKNVRITTVEFVDRSLYCRKYGNSGGIVSAPEGKGGRCHRGSG